MNYLEELLHNTILINAVTGWLCAQILKTITHLIINKKFVWERLVGDGGMPSAHSATVCALAGTTFLHCGPVSPEFAIAAIFAIIVMHDAMGVRFETGKQAKILNEMMDIFKSMGNSTLTAEEKLKEFKLELNRKTNIYDLKHGFGFLGYQFLLKGKRLIIKINPGTKRRIKKKMRKLKKINAPNYEQVKASYMGYLTVAHSKNLLKKLDL